MRILLIAVMLAISTPAIGETVTITASQDNTIYNHDERFRSNGAGDFLFVGRTGGADAASFTAE
jgi:hypothetical protein